MLEKTNTVDAILSESISTTATIRESIEAHAEEPVIIVVPIGGDASEFE